MHLQHVLREVGQIDPPDATSLAAVLGLEVFKFERLRGV